MRGSAPAPEAVDRFRADLTSLFHRHPGPEPGSRFSAKHEEEAGSRLEAGMTLGLAVSGGPDSMAMLALAHAAFPGCIAAATFDHRLRDGSAEEASLVAAACDALGVPHTILHPDHPIAGSSLQMRARTARYAALTAWAGDRPLLTAHHADDQAETLLMRLNRGSGLAGLSAIRAARREGATLVLRPLLGWRRAELRAVVEASGLPFVDDPSNLDPRHDRTRIRTFLAAAPLLDAPALAASARYLAEAEEVVRTAADRLWAEWRHDAPLPAAEHPRELRRRLLRRAILAVRHRHAILRPAFTESSNVEPLLDALEGARASVQGGVKVTPTPAGWTFAPAPPRRSH